MKRAMVSFSLIMIIAKALLVTIGLLGLVIITSVTLNLKVDTSAVAIETQHHALESSSSLHPIDALTQREDIGIIDLEKFLNLDTSRALEEELAYRSDHIATQLVLSDAQGTAIATHISPDRTTYELLLARSKSSGAGSTREKTSSRSVVIKDGEDFYRGMLETSIVVEVS